MAVNWELDPERPATMDEEGRRVYLYPADVKGWFRTLRNRMHFVMLLIFLGLPWVRINGKQALLLDVSQRKFEIFGLSLRAHNAPLFFFVLAMAGFGLFFVTSIWGRVWCGWACPQTVFIEGIYRRIERWIEGPSHKRRALAEGPWTRERIVKHVTKWALYVVASLVLTHSFLAYFVGTETLAHMITRSPKENWTSFVFILFSTGIILFDFAWFREQFCTIACPYGRFQSVLMDDNSMVVAYDKARGEPRRTVAQKDATGDCVNCYRCVQVCPTGVDIRRGTQLECIACTSCIDACDEVMDKLKKPRGLIRYDSARGLAKLPVHKLRPRSLVYLTIVVLAGSALTYFLATLNPISVVVLRAKEAPYRVLTDDQGRSLVMNQFSLELTNQSNADHELRLSVSDSLAQQGVEIVSGQNPLTIKPGNPIRSGFFLRLPQNLVHDGQVKIPLTITDTDLISQTVRTYEEDLAVLGPLKSHD